MRNWILAGAAICFLDGAQAQEPPGKPVRSCESLAELKDLRPNLAVDSAQLAASGKVCRVDLSVTHPPAGDRVRIFVALPMENWNGRFQGNGGGGFSGGSPNSLNGPAQAGYAAASTDTGHEGGSGSFALDADGRPNWMRIRDNAYLGIHEMTLTAKELVKVFYGRPAAKSYFAGCSTGGRQGLMEAQRFPEDYDGILSGAPAINWTRLHMAQMWGHVVMAEARHMVAPCKLTAAVSAAVTACDAIDGVMDGVIGHPLECRFDPGVAMRFQPAGCEPLSEADVAVIRRIWDGPTRRDGGARLWYGFARGADLVPLNRTANSAAAPMGITLDWWRYFLLKDPKWTWPAGEGMTRDWYEQLWQQSEEEFSLYATDNADLSGFRSRGGRIVLWHGWADPLIHAQGTIDYYTRVRERMGAGAAGEILRFYLAPGVGHCAGGPGPQPVGLMDALVKWVEQGVAPGALLAEKRQGPPPPSQGSGPVTQSRPLCVYPQVARYRGTGSQQEAASFECADRY